MCFLQHEQFVFSGKTRLFTHLDFFFGVIHIWGLFLEFSRYCFKFLGDGINSGTEVLFNFSGSLNFPLFRQNLKQHGRNVSVPSCKVDAYVHFKKKRNQTAPDPQWRPKPERPRPTAWRFQRAEWCRGRGICSVAALLVYPHSDDR